MTTHLSEETIKQIRQLINATREVTTNIKQTNAVMERILEPKESINELASILERYDKLKSTHIQTENKT